MKRFHLFELHEQSWVPAMMRHWPTDFLHTLFARYKIYNPIIPCIKKVLAELDSNEIIDCCSGGTGPIIEIFKELKKDNIDPKITLTDKFPNIDAFERISAMTNGDITYCSNENDVCEMSVKPNTLHTFFSCFHQFKPNDAQNILRNLSSNNAAIGVFEFTENSMRRLLKDLMIPFVILYLMPTVKPFKLSRLIFTYLIPLLPLMLFWDDMVSNVRTYSVSQLEKMVEPLQRKGYSWEIGQESSEITGHRLTYLIGYPTKNE